MKVSVFALFDAKVGLYEIPHTQRTTAEALRAFAGEANNPQSKIGQHPQDFTIFHLGYYDDEKGKYENLATPTALAVGSELVRKGTPGVPPELRQNQ